MPRKTQIMSAISASGLTRAKKILDSFQGIGGLPLLTERQMKASNKLVETLVAKKVREDPSKAPSVLLRSQKQAAVLVPIACVRGKLSVIFTKRSDRVGSHRGQISFPGGHIDNNETVQQAALREIEEELNGNYNYGSAIEVLGQTQTVPALTGTRVTPVVAALTNKIDDLAQVFKPHDDEVEFVFSRSIDELLRAEHIETLMRMDKAPIYPGAEGEIWGLTAIILGPILHQVIKPAFLEPSGKL